jgi:mannosylglycoprotein endo-beta-mannosidase
LSIPAAQTRGAFLRHTLDVTAQAEVRGRNNLAVAVYPPDHPGCVELGGQGGDHMIAQDVTPQFVEGWDWTCPIPDRNTGLWDKVTAASVEGVG